MKFHSLSVSNLRAVRRFQIDDLGDFVVIAGQNGCGKSCVFDALRLLKSVYGGYSQNEFHQWFTEFAINLQNQQAIRKLFRDPSSPIKIDATFSFTDSEVAYMSQNTEALVQPIAWQEVTGQPVDFWTFNRIAVATQLPQVQARLAPAVQRLSSEVRQALSKTSVHALSLVIEPSGDLRLEECKPAEVAFQAYEPEHLGVLEYHSASRSYARQDVGGINLDARSFEDQRRQQRLYNWQAKYQNVKTELATSYLRTMIAKESGDLGIGDDLNETLRELFQTFFPDKTYEGVRPQARGALEFPVRLKTGEVHDIDDLSSGEKEILYGYLKLKNSTPPNSVILLDEPELHLHPTLLQGFADFYYRNLGLSQGNQLWLVTHSDTLLRQAVGNTNYRVYQMLPAASAEPSDNQAVEVVADDDVERVTIELVGDLTAYRPHGKVVILEGRSENGFDVNMVTRLFPQFARRVNLVSGGHKQRVRDLYAVLRDAASQAGIKNRFFAIVDKDSEAQLGITTGASEFSWDVYHIENYLLDPGSIRAALATLTARDVYSSDDEVVADLRDSATKLIDSLVLERLQADVNREFVEAIRIGAPPDTTSVAESLIPSIAGSLSRVNHVGEGLTLDVLSGRAQNYRDEFEAALSDETWLRQLPGRPILRRFAHTKLGNKIDGAMFCNAVLDKMVERGITPEGMQVILEEIGRQ